jgi:ATP-dependent 26S proteasome regulatory subunit
MEFHEELETLIRARYPIIYIVSREEARAQAAVSEIARQRGKKIFEWSCTTGLIPPGTPGASSKSRNLPTRDPVAALDQVVDHVEPALFIFKDLHLFLSRQQTMVVRRLKEVALHLKSSFKSLIIVAPILEIPLELEKEVTVLHLPLPNAKELNELLNDILRDLHEEQSVRLELDDDGREQLVRAAQGLTLGEAENVFAKIVVKTRRLDGEQVGEVLAEKKQIVEKSGLLECHSSAETVSDLGGLEALKEWLRKRSAALTDRARKFGLPAPKGVLLLGVQGCGKSLAAKAIANAWQLPLLRLDVGRLFSGLVGSSEENARRAIAVAESIAPAVLWIDEIDKALAGTQGSGVSDGGTTARVFGTFLTWLSEKTSPVFVVATANDVTQLPPELLRKGRFDEIFFVDLPHERERRDIFSIHLRKRGREPENFDLAALAGGSNGFSGAEIEQAVVSGLFDAFSENVELRDDHLRGALTETVPLSKTMAEQIADFRAWVGPRARNASGE